jgi:DNA-binding NarL/FixJ family response regulator
MAVRVLVVDDREPFRLAAAAVVGTTPGFVLAGEASTGEDALEAVRRLLPDVVLLDVVLPGMDGWATADRIRAGHPSVRLVLLSTYDGAEQYDRAASAGLRFVPKDRFGADVLLAAVSTTDDSPPDGG